ncbi:putative P-type ATPase, HAD-like superfamily [Helianthus anomalus]
MPVSFGFNQNIVLTTKVKRAWLKFSIFDLDYAVLICSGHGSFSNNPNNNSVVIGDNINTTKAIARECGILTDDGIAIEGPDFREKTEDECLKLFLKFRCLCVMARSFPMDKHTLVNHLRTTFEEVVIVTRDGTNDAPALHEAAVGLAMGIVGMEVAKASADVIILDDNFSTIVTVAKWGCSVYVNIQKFVQFQLTVNVVALIVNFSSACLTGSAPLTVVQLLWVSMIMDTLGALALATKPPMDELMERQPFGRKGNFITNVMWRNIMGQSLYQTMKPSKQVIGLVSRLVFYFNFWSVGFRVFQTVANSLVYDLDQKSPYKTRLNRMI